MARRSCAGQATQSSASVTAAPKPAASGSQPASACAATAATGTLLLLNLPQGGGTLGMSWLAVRNVQVRARISSTGVSGKPPRQWPAAPGPSPQQMPRGSLQAQPRCAYPSGSPATLW